MQGKPSESELEIMQVLWEKGPLTVREINDFLNLERRVGYTTTLKIMQIMTDKGILTRDTSQRSHVYTPALNPEEVQSTILDHVIKTVFRGNTSNMVLKALGNHSASSEEMDEIKALIEKIENQQHGNMEIFESSQSWIMALGKTLLHSLWAGVLFLAVLKLAFVFVKPRFAELRYRIASVLLFLFAGSMVTMFLLFYAPATEPGKMMPGPRSAHPVYTQLASGTDWLRIWIYYTPYLYFSGICIYLLYTVSSLLHIRSIRRSAKPVQGIWIERFMEMREKTGTPQPVSLLESESIETPFLSGLIKPLIVVPAGMLTQLPFSQVEAILVHELFHLKRLDHLVNMFQRIVEILFFYHPAVWILSRIVRKEREICCDDMVLKVCQKPLMYARALYQLAKVTNEFPSMAPAATGSHRGQLYKRIQRILNQKSMKTNIREKLSAMILLTGALLIVALISGFSSALSITQYNDQPDEFLTPEAAQVIQAVAPVEPARSGPPPPPAQPDTTIEAVQVIEEDDVMDEANWEKIKAEMEQASVEIRESMESIDWDEIREEMEAARLEAMESIDWDEIKEEMEAARLEAMESIDWDEIREEMEAARLEAMESIDWDEIREEMEACPLGSH